uniref:Uncharacterized protein n=1 Tax=Romanomermis culicivorax TaxID=13658 RepID=A0A915HEY3_ROMCU
MHLFIIAKLLLWKNVLLLSALIRLVLLAGRFDFRGDLERSTGDFAHYNYFVLLFSRGVVLRLSAGAA